MTNEKTILVIDDDSDVHELCRISLKAAGVRVVCASSAAEGKALTASERPDGVILDIMMEEADSGLHLARWLRDEHPAIPVMLMSSILDAGAEVFDIFSVPAAMRVNKPLSPKEITAQVQSMIARKG